MGHASIALAERFPHLNFVVQDLAEIVAAGESELPSGLKNRVTFQTHDFFTPQPVQGADVYLLRFILHDYSDTHATRILKNLLPAFKPTSRLLVMDGVLPEPGTMPKSEERLIRYASGSREPSSQRNSLADKNNRVMDLEMLTNFNSKERDIEDWRSLFTKADPRLKLRKVTKPPGSVNSIVEAVLEEVE